MLNLEVIPLHFSILQVLRISTKSNVEARQNSLALLCCGVCVGGPICLVPVLQRHFRRYIRAIKMKTSIIYILSALLVLLSLAALSSARARGYNSGYEKELQRGDYAITPVCN